MATIVDKVIKDYSAYVEAANNLDKAARVHNKPRFDKQKLGYTAAWQILIEAAIEYAKASGYVKAGQL